MFEDIMDEGIELSVETITTETMRKHYPNYLHIQETIILTLNSCIDPSGLLKNCAYIYGNNLYITDTEGNLAYIDCDMVHTKNATKIKAAHPEYKRTGGKYANHEGMDAGHFGVQLGQHPSMSMEQDATMNRYGTWRTLERYWLKLLKEGHTVNVKAVFVDDGLGGTFSPFWCVCDTIDGIKGDAHALLNEADQF